MPADTAGSMILGYAVILGILALYVVTLIVRTKRVKRDQRKK